MGRKIPGKKHRGVKDPLKQQLEKKQKLKLVINAPPTNPNIQEIPKSVLELNRLRELVKSGKKPKRKKKRNLIDTSNFSTEGPKLPGLAQDDSYIPKLKQKPGESDSAFLWRIDLATNEVINEAQMEAKHGVVVNRDKSGKVINVKPNKIFHETQKESKGKIKKTLMPESSRSGGLPNSKLQRLKEKKEFKNALKKVKYKEEEFEKKKDYVKFGEVVHQPPQISRRPRGCDTSSCDRPGRKELLLKTLLGRNNESKSMSERKQIATAREEAMKVYKAMKARNYELSKNFNKF